MRSEEIKSGIKNNKILNKIIFFDSIDSTNKYLSENDFASGTIAIAAEQAAGRGKHGAKWLSDRGGLWFSFVINKKIKRPYDYVVLTAVAIAETIKKYGLKVEIKWPNDIIVCGKKIAGILLENDYFSGRLIVGMGINANNKPPEGKGLNAVSLKQLLRKTVDIAILAVEVINKIDLYLAGFKTKRANILKKWMDFQKNLEGTEIRLIKRGKEEQIQVLKVSGGSIKFRDKKGKVKTLSGEIFFK